MENLWSPKTGESDPTITQWEESDSELFIRFGKTYVPCFNEVKQAFIESIPFNQNHSFNFTELGTGSGWLSKIILNHFPNSFCYGLDGSKTMLDCTHKNLNKFSDRYQLHSFQLENAQSYLPYVEKSQLVVSSLVIHHLDDQGKKDLYQKIFNAIKKPCCFLNFDLLEPTNCFQQKLWENEWNQITKKQVSDEFKTAEAYEYFKNQNWNYYQHLNDPIDKPSNLVNQLNWLKNAGASSIEVAFLRAGHGLLASYREQI